MAVWSFAFLLCEASLRPWEMIILLQGLQWWRLQTPVDTSISSSSYFSRFVLTWDDIEMVKQLNTKVVYKWLSGTLRSRCKARSYIWTIWIHPMVLITGRNGKSASCTQNKETNVRQYRSRINCTLKPFVISERWRPGFHGTLGRTSKMVFILELQAHLSCPPDGV